MKYTGNTISKPVVGKEAKALVKAVKSGGYIANEQGIATAKRIAEQIVKRETDAGDKI
ncbi:hypothetical protein SAMN05216327_105248 [Dyadobacter sp. SG02]|uniref:hypothetical protein n=1 Tax=Dyadobacter sp. SG02 TaxID=1855291 RepID=UPI0008B45AAA|nr:hypothetical protein [Dyadobacter sp. SG02]SEJ00822.1 hypothetical protein SAMN05216327_105248 [Dyadobacter sp. SG02]